MANIDDFKANLIGGGARANQFRVTITPPAGITIGLDVRRASFRNLVEPFLRDVQGRRGIFDFKVVCDDTNNTAEIIDRNEFIGDIFIKPSKSINFITLNFVAVRTGVEFDEVVGRF